MVIDRKPKCCGGSVAPKLSGLRFRDIVPVPVTGRVPAEELVLRIHNKYHPGEPIDPTRLKVLARQTEANRAEGQSEEHITKELELFFGQELVGEIGTVKANQIVQALPSAESVILGVWHKYYQSDINLPLQQWIEFVVNSRNRGLHEVDIIAELDRAFAPPNPTAKKSAAKTLLGMGAIGTALFLLL